MIALVSRWLMLFWQNIVSNVFSIRNIKHVAPNLIPVFLALIFWDFMQPEDAGRYSPYPRMILASLIDLTERGILVSDLIASVVRVLIGFLIALIVGFLTGLLLGRIRILRLIIYPLIEVIRPIPPIAWIPLSIIWFGIGLPSAVFIIFLGAVFPVFSVVRRHWVYEVEFCFTRRKLAFT